MGKRANIRDTRRATETLVWQGRAAHLREQGLLLPSAGAAEAQAFDRAEAKAARRAAEKQYREDMGPNVSLWFGLFMAVLAVVIWAAGAAPLGFIIGLFALGSLLIWVFDVLFRAADRRADRRVSR